MTTINHSAIAIRPGTETDARRLAALSIQVWLDTYATEGVSEAIAEYVLSTFNPARFAALSQAPDTSLWVAQAQAHLVGYALLRKGPDPVLDAYRDTELCTLYVQAPFIGKGVGSQLLGAALDKAVDRLWLSVNAGNRRAIAFYRKHGFVIHGSRPFVLDGVSHDNHLMVLDSHRTKQPCSPTSSPA